MTDNLLHANKVENVTALPPLPAVAHTRDGQAFTPGDAVWTLRKRADGGGTLQFNWARIRFSPASLHLTKLILASTAGTLATLSTNNTFTSLVLFGDWYSREYPDAGRFEWTDMTAKLARAFLAFGMTRSDKGNPLSRVRTLYRYGVESLRRPEFDERVLLALDSIRAPGNVKGGPVLSADPETGSFTASEVDAILAAIASGRGEPHDRALVWLALEVGRRPLQCTLLRNADLLRVNTVQADGLPTRLYQLRFRRTKKRKVLDGTMVMPISKELGDVLWDLRRGHDGERLLHWIDGANPEGAFKYRMRRWADATKLTTTRSQPSVAADDSDSGQENEGVEAIDVVSSREPKRMHLYPYRFRYTIATNAHEEGASAERIAILLDHDDLQNTKVYTANSALSVLRIQDKVNSIYDPLVKRFRGQWSESTAPTGPDGEPGRMIPGYAPQIELDVGGIGHCGRKTLCNLAPPLTCYACDKFVAFTDGPHREVVVKLAAMMENAEPRIALQLAPALAAAREVVAYLEENQIT